MNRYDCCLLQLTCSGVKAAAGDFKLRLLAAPKDYNQRKITIQKIIKSLFRLIPSVNYLEPKDLEW